MNDKTMSNILQWSRTLAKSEIVIATGFTSAFVGDDRNLREYLVAEYVAKALQRNGLKTRIVLINDSYDALTFRQLRIGVGKDSKLIEKYASFCGQPIAEIPDPFGQYASYAEFFMTHFLIKLRKLEICPEVIDTYELYKEGQYATFIDLLFENFQAFSNLVRQPFRIQCPSCHRIDTTHIIEVSNTGITSYYCTRCDRTLSDHFRSLKGKMAWKVECAARWALRDVDIEPFSSRFLGSTGSYNVSSIIAGQFFAKKAPFPIKYGQVKIDSDVPAGDVLGLLPLAACKELYISNFASDIRISRARIMQSARKYHMPDGRDFYTYARHAITFKSQSLLHELSTEEISYHNYALNFGSRLLHDVPRLRYPDNQAMDSMDSKAMISIHKLIKKVIDLQENGDHLNIDQLNSVIRTICKEDQISEGSMILHLRMLLTQEKVGPGISMLQHAPHSYLRKVLYLLRARLNNHSQVISDTAIERVSSSVQPADSQ